ncbi:MAG: hypothetical protein WD844_14980 [Thermoleophilaceae bacterium]
MSDPHPEKPDEPPTGFPEPPGSKDPGDRSRDPDGKPSGEEPHPPGGSQSTSEPHPSDDPEAEPWEGPKRDIVDE